MNWLFIRPAFRFDPDPDSGSTPESAPDAPVVDATSPPEPPVSEETVLEEVPADAPAVEETAPAPEETITDQQATAASLTAEEIAAFRQAAQELQGVKTSLTQVQAENAAYRRLFEGQEQEEALPLDRIAAYRRSFLANPKYQDVPDADIDNAARDAVRREIAKSRGAQSSQSMQAALRDLPLLQMSFARFNSKETGFDSNDLVAFVMSKMQQDTTGWVDPASAQQQQAFQDFETILQRSGPTILDRPAQLVEQYEFLQWKRAKADTAAKKTAPPPRVDPVVQAARTSRVTAIKEAPADSAPKTGEKDSFERVDGLPIERTVQEEWDQYRGRYIDDYPEVDDAGKPLPEGTAPPKFVRALRDSLKRAGAAA